MTSHNDDTIHAMTIRQQQEAQMKPADLTAYKAVYPEFVDIQESTRKWSTYTFDGLVSAAVCELPNGTIVRLCDVIAEETDDYWFDHLTVVSLSYLKRGDGPIQMFQNMRAMIAHDLAEDERAQKRNDNVPTQSRILHGGPSLAWVAFEAKHPARAEDLIEHHSLGSELMSITGDEIAHLMALMYEGVKQ